MANMVAGGKTPLLSSEALKRHGVQVAVHHPLLFSAVRAMQDAAAALRGDNGAGAPPVASFAEVKRLVGVPEYEAMERGYAIRG